MLYPLYFCICCTYKVAPEQKARTTYDNLLRLIDNPDVREPLKFLRAREIVHFQRFGDANLTKLSKSYPLQAVASRGNISNEFLYITANRQSILPWRFAICSR